MTAVHLTKRETQVLNLMAQGKHNSEIAVLLNVSEHTAKFHINSVFRKFQQTTRLGAVVYALKHGVLNLASLMPEIPYKPFTATEGALLEENAIAMEEQKNNMIENIVNDIVEKLEENKCPVMPEDKTGIYEVLKEYFSA